MGLSNMKPKYWLFLGVAAVGGAQAVACSSASHSCEETRSCTASEAGAAQGEAGAAGAPAAGGGAAQGDAEGGEGGAAGGPALTRGPVLFGSCSLLGALACQGVASVQRLACDGSKWQAGTTCADGELCDSGTGECAKQIAECVGAKPGQEVCREDKPLTCGPDLVSATEGQACAGLCKDGVCQAPVCGDKKLEAGEDCDDGDTTGAGACVKCKTATCGDGVVYAGHEECDDGNTVAGDGCSSTCAWEPIAIAAGDVSTCALSKNGAVKCWGDNTHGELGIGSIVSHGIVFGDMGTALPAVSLGRAAKAISVGAGSACAILDNGELKCWGSNQFGELGQGSSVLGTDIGDQNGEVDNLLPIKFGAGRTVTAVSQGGSHTCAILDNGDLTCWGNGGFGQLGQDDGLDYASPPPAAINLGGKATAVSAGPASTTCALLADGTGKCWGIADHGSLSVAISDDKGAAPGSAGHVVIGDYKGPNAPQGEMALLPALGFGTGLLAKQIGAGYVSSCALLSNNKVNCWGSSSNGELGLGNVGVQAGNYPDALAALTGVKLGEGRTVKSIAVGALHACAILDDGSVTCWGSNAYGQLGIGSKVNQGDKPTDVGHLLPVPLGGRKAVQLAAGAGHTCALLDNGTVECWGYNPDGELGVGNIQNLGDVSPFVLTPVKLAF
jgi:cysteine-rich repeat protein